MMSKIGSRDERGYNQIFSQVGSTPFRAKRRNEWFANKARDLGAKRILEIGCGTGEAASFIARHVDAEVIGVDLSKVFIEQAALDHQLPNLQFKQIDLLNESKIELGEFDFIYGNGILHHLILQLDNFLIITKSMLRSGGGVAFIEPNFLNPYCAFIFGTSFGRKFAKLEPDEMAFMRNDLFNHFARTGWSGISIDTRDFLIPGIPVSFIGPVLFIEPVLEATNLTRWLAQSHFILAYV